MTGGVMTGETGGTGGTGGFCGTGETGGTGGICGTGATGETGGNCPACPASPSACLARPAGHPPGGGNATAQPPHLGDPALLALPFTALLSSRRVAPAAVMRAYDWATEAAAAGRCVASGFQSPLERDVLSLLLRGKSPVILALARGLWRTVPPELRAPIAEGRLCVVSPVSPLARRATAETAAARNAWLLDHCEDAVFASLDPAGSLARLVAERPSIRHLVLA